MSSNEQRAADAKRVDETTANSQKVTRSVERTSRFVRVLSAVLAVFIACLLVLGQIQTVSLLDSAHHQTLILENQTSAATQEQGRAEVKLIVTCVQNYIDHDTKGVPITAPCAALVHP